MPLLPIGPSVFSGSNSPMLVAEKALPRKHPLARGNFWIDSTQAGSRGWPHRNSVETEAILAQDFPEQAAVN